MLPKTLVVLLARYTSLAGSFDALSNHVSLKIVDLSGTLAAGTLANFQNLTALESLYLAYTNLRGSLSSLSNLTQLRGLRLNSADVEGDLSAFAKMTKLASLDLEHVRIRGALAALSLLTQLQELVLIDAPLVVGSLGSLLPLSGLRSILLWDVALNGSFPNVDTLANLSSLVVVNASLRGPLPRMPESLNYLNLNHNQIFLPPPNAKTSYHPFDINLPNVKCVFFVLSLRALSILSIFVLVFCVFGQSFSHVPAFI